MNESLARVLDADTLSATEEQSTSKASNSSRADADQPMPKQLIIKELRTQVAGNATGETDLLTASNKPNVSVRPRFIPLQKWEGTVLKLTRDTFICRLTDLQRYNLHEEAEIPLEEIPETDRHLVEPGAVFYWNIGYLDNLDGQRTRASRIRFRRLPVWTKAELNKAEMQAKRLRSLLGYK